MSRKPVAMIVQLPDNHYQAIASEARHIDVLPEILIQTVLERAVCLGIRNLATGPEFRRHALTLQAFHDEERMAR